LPFIKNDATILDLGSGTSFIAKNLTAAKNNYKIFEIDISVT
jgi:methylase of polypeptide subunit release factors